MRHHVAANMLQWSIYARAHIRLGTSQRAAEIEQRSFSVCWLIDENMDSLAQRAFSFCVTVIEKRRGFVFV